jgi:hypothetical protein
MPLTYIYKSVNIPELFRPIIKEVETNLAADLLPFGIQKINYLFGTWNYCTNQLAVAAGNPQNANTQFPLVALITDFTKTHNESIEFETSLKFVICNLGQVNMLNEERYSLNFEKILYPIYDEFLALCEASGNFLGYANKGIPHEVDEKPFQGVTGVTGTTGLQLHEVLDGLLISEFKVKLRKQKNC